MVYTILQVGCKSQDHERLDRQESAADLITVLRQQLYDGVSEEDLEKTMSMWAEDAIRFAPNAAPSVGVSSIQHQFQQLFAACDVVRFEGETKEIQVSGDLAYSLGEWNLDLTCGGGSEMIQSRGNVILLWRREAIGGWKITRDIFNELP